MVDRNNNHCLYHYNRHIRGIVMLREIIIFNSTRMEMGMIIEMVDHMIKDHIQIQIHSLIDPNHLVMGNSLIENIVVDIAHID